ncbi:MAG: FAD-linked oxidase [Chloroflexi bacterium]|nr:FAD-linked oxidase [Chloroflexota bacterium]|tara:strand:- start:92 stop:1480 length:1389 start_codon:yes stop_codon:yes gene_type:complete
MAKSSDTSLNTISSFISAIGGIEHSLDPSSLRKGSRDFYWFSPILKEKLQGILADVIVLPSTEEEVIEIIKACVDLHLPLTIRGAGTGNYGQAMPLEGGVVLDTKRLSNVKEVRKSTVLTEPGIKLVDLERETLKTGQELRLYPSTKRTATIGGFIAGGSTGVGAIKHGYLADSDNIKSLRIITMEREPRILTLKGRDIGKAAHAYGTNGIITELEIGLAESRAWTDVIVSFPDFNQSLYFTQALAHSNNINTKEIAIFEAPVTNYFPDFNIPTKEHSCFAMVQSSDLDHMKKLIVQSGGTLVYEKNNPEKGKQRPLYEFTWNHTTLHAINRDPGITYLQSLFLVNDNFTMIKKTQDYFKNELLMHFEAVLWNGKFALAGLQLVRYTSEDRLNEIIKYHEENGIPVFNPHTHILEDGGMKVIDPLQLDFKKAVDPKGLMNPGKMRGWWEGAQGSGTKSAIFK